MNKILSSLNIFSAIMLFFASTVFAAIENTSAETDTSQNITPLIVGGDFALEGEHPWVVYLSSSSTGQNAYCGGSLINSEWVLTAAHCIGSGTIYIAAGVYNRNTSTAANTFVVQNRYVHPGYSSVSSGNDIALLRLSSSVPTSLVDVYAQLPSVSVDSTYAGTGDLVKVIGWGTTSSGGSQSTILREVFVPVTSEAVCNNAYGSIDYDTQVCAGYTNGGRDSCQGDSGGPLLFTQGGQDYVAGVVSFGNGCALPNFPGVYTRTAGFLNWIASYVDVDTGGGTGGGTDGGNTVVELNNGDSGSISGATNEELFFSINVPSGAELEVTIAGGSGDADLYTRFGSLPTTSTYDCRPYVGGNNESCSDTNSAGTYYIMVRGYSAFSGVTLSVNYSGGTGGGDGGSGGGTVNNLSVTQGNWTESYTLEVPSGISTLDVDIFGANGDADVYVYYNTSPTDTVNASVDTSTRCVPWAQGSNESCSINNPAAGTWYIRIYAYATFSDLTLEAAYEP